MVPRRTWAHAVSTWFDRGRGLALGITLAGTGLAGLIAPKAVDSLIQDYGWRGGYIGLALFTAIVAYPIVFLFFRERPVTQAVRLIDDRATVLTGMSAAEAVRTIRFWQIAFGILLIGAAIASILVHLVPLLTDAGMPRGDATGIASLVGFAIVVSRIFAGRLVDRFHGPYVAGIVLAAPALGDLLIAGHPSGGWELYLAALAIGLCAGAEIDLLAFLIGRFFGLKRFGAIYGLLLVAFATGSGLSPMLMGHIYDVTRSYNEGLYAGAIASVVGALLFATLGRYPKEFARPD